MIVIADTAPINYLVLVGEQELLPVLFGQVIIPEAVFRELQGAATPQVVQQWIAHRPQWFEMQFFLERDRQRKARNPKPQE